VVQRLPIRAFRYWLFRQRQSILGDVLQGECFPQELIAMEGRAELAELMAFDPKVVILERLAESGVGFT
jgi:hypothetical protein